MRTSMIKPIGYLLLRWRLVVVLLGGILIAMGMLLYATSRQSGAQTTAVEPEHHYIAAGDNHSLAAGRSPFYGSGVVWGWGNNYRGELGDGQEDTASHVPVHTQGLTDVESVAAGSQYSLALKSDGTIYSWGWNDPGCQLGDGNPPWIYHVDPREVMDGPSGDAIAAGLDHSLALDKDGYVYAWGNNDNGQLGIGRRPPYYCFADKRVPDPDVNDQDLFPVKAIGAGDKHSLAVMEDQGGAVYAWGNNSYGQLGNGVSGGNSDTPVQVLGGQQGTEYLTGVKAVAGGNNHSLALMEDGTVYAWGHNLYGQLGVHSDNPHETPQKVHGVNNVGYLSGIVAVAAGEHHSLAVRNDGTVYAWGGNGHGQLGIHSDNDHTIPYPVHGKDNVGYLTGITDVAAGKFFSLALRSDGTVWAWGEGHYGQLGINSDNDHTIPYQVHGQYNGQPPDNGLSGIGPAVASNPPPVEPVDGKYPICLKKGTPKEQELYVPESALKGHLVHGATLGECP